MPCMTGATADGQSVLTSAETEVQCEILRKVVHTVDVFQRNLLRGYLLQIFLPKKITNEELHRITKQQPWSNNGTPNEA